MMAMVETRCSGDSQKPQTNIHSAKGLQSTQTTQWQCCPIYTSVPASNSSAISGTQHVVYLNKVDFYSIMLQFP